MNKQDQLVLEELVKLRKLRGLLEDFQQLLESSRLGDLSDDERNDLLDQISNMYEQLSLNLHAIADYMDMQSRIKN